MSDERLNMNTSMICVDEIRDYPGKGRWCHLWHLEGDKGALDAFAASIGLKRSWAHLSRGRSGEFYHYDLTPAKRQLALTAGATYMSLADYIRSKTSLLAGSTREQGNE